MRGGAGEAWRGSLSPEGSHRPATKFTRIRKMRKTWVNFAPGLSGGQG